MAATELAIRYTEEKYLTKNEVIRDLKMNIVDGIWSNILNYRNNFNHYTALRSIERGQYSVCLCNLVNNSVNNLLLKENRYLNETKFIPGCSEEKMFIDNSLVSSCGAIAKLNGVDISNNIISAKINEENVTLNPSNEVVINYYKALLFAMNYSGDINESFLLSLYSKMTSNAYASFRSTEDLSRANRVLIDRLYTSAPVQLVPSLVNQLLMFIDNSTLDKYIKASAILYYFDYVKPFDKYNSEMATLLAKTVLARESSKDVFYLPIEELFVFTQKELDKVTLDTQKSTDLTYFVLFILNKINEMYSTKVDYIINLKTSGMKKDFHELDDIDKPQEKEEPIVSEVEPEPVIEEPIPEPVVEQPMVEEVISEPEPIKEVEVKPIEKKPKPIKVVTKVNKEDVDQLAFNYVAVKLDDREVRKMVEQLLEDNPLLSKKEARFYAKHCSIGKMYSISQFKKDIGCVYETARTSMDHLAALGYYKKEQIKNKFFYTPISRK